MRSRRRHLCAVVNFCSKCTRAVSSPKFVLTTCYCRIMATSSVSNREALCKLDNQLTCAICLERYTDPKTLSCHHSYCKNCIDRLPVELDNGRQLVRCPKCRHSSQLSEKGASALPAAFHINNLLEIEDVLKRTPARGLVHTCHTHWEKPADLYCDTCEEHICITCSKESHRDHQFDRAVDMFVIHKQMIESCLDLLREQIFELRETLTRYDTREREIREQGEAVQKEIDETYQKLIDQLQESRRKLSQEAAVSLQEKLQLHSFQRGDVEAVLEQLKYCHEFVEEKLQSRSRYQIQAAKRWLIRHVHKTISEVKMSELQPAQDPTSLFVADENTESACGHIGEVSSKLSFSPPGLFLVDIPSRVLVHAYSEVQVLLTTPVSLSADRLCCQLTPTQRRAFRTPKPVNFPVIGVQEGQFKVKIRSSTVGLHQLRVLVDGVDVYGSPFNVNITGCKRTNLVGFATNLSDPAGMTVTDDKQYVVVAERGAHQVAVLSNSGRILKRFGSRGDDFGEFVSPRGVAVSDEHIFVADSRRLQKFIFPSTYVASFNVISTGVAVHPNGKVFCTNANQSNITVLNFDLTHSHSFGNGLLTLPYKLAIDTKGMVYVTDKAQAVVHKFTPEGDHLGTVGSRGKQPNQFERPLGICIDSNDIMYITDCNKLMVFTTEGTFLGSFVGSGIQVLIRLNLHGVAVNKTGNVYVSDSNSGEILVSKPS